MQRRGLIFLLLVGLLLPAASRLEAVGTVTFSCPSSQRQGPVWKCTWTWTADGSGNVSGNTKEAPFGSVIRFDTDPDAGGLAPDDNYDITLLDSFGVDVLGGNGVNRDTANVESVTLSAPVWHNGAGSGGRTLDLTISGAGAANSGVLVVWISSAGPVGGGSSGSGSSFNGVLLDAASGDPVTDTTNDAIRVNVVAGAAAGGTSSDIGAAVPTPATAAGFSDGTNLQLAKVFDLDSGAGVDRIIGAALRIGASGGSIAASAGAGAVDAGTLRVILPTDQSAIPASQSGTWTVQPGNTANTTAWFVAGGKTNNNAAPGATNLGTLSFLANAAVPSWTEGNLVAGSVDLSGRLRTIISGCTTCTATETAITEDASYTTQQTGAAVWTPSAGLKIYVASVDIQCGGTTAGTVRLWFGASGDTTYSAGTDQQLTFMNCGTPTADIAPGKVVSFAIPVAASTADFILRATTSAGVTVEIIVHGYER